MALTYVGGIVGGRVGSTGTNLTISLTALTGGSNSSPSMGDIVIAVCSTGSVADRSIGVVSPAGYLELTELYSNDSVDTNLSVSWKIMGSTPDTSVVFSPSGNTADAISATVHVWRGVDADTPFDVTLTTNTGIDTGRPTPPAILPTTSGAIIICIGAGAAATGAVYTTATLSNFITRTDADTYDSMAGMGSFAWSSGTYTPAQFGGGTTATTDSWCAATLVLRPKTSTPYTATLSDVSTISATLNVIQSSKRNLVETMGLSDAITKKSAFNKKPSETVSLTDNLLTSHGMKITLKER